ncbi:MAG TPA: hypothetical protein ENI49_06215, partial [Thermoplasmatales archaeon]|nr:hypothetical protein [Thermoplasmatales archaeon]
MRKLNQRKIRWIIREMEKGERSVYRIAKLQNVTPRWVRELYRRYREKPSKSFNPSAYSGNTSM